MTTNGLPDGAAEKGGRARAKVLTKHERQEIAREAAQARWKKAAGQKLRRAITEDANIYVGDREFECAVLDGEVRVISERAFSRAIGAKRGGSHWIRKKADPKGANLPVFLSAKNLRPFINMDLAAALSEPIIYITKGGQRANGIDAEYIPQILEVWLKAREAGVLTVRQEPFAVVAEIIMRGLAHTGIIALIDEATGYQDLRTKNALAKILESYIAKELRKWVKTFPVAYFKELCRLKGIPFRSDMKLPPYFGHHTNDIVYSRLAPGVLDELKKRNPRAATGRKSKHHQLLTEDLGHPRLLQHLSMVIGLMRASDDWDTFHNMLDRAAPVYRDMPLFASTLESESGN